MILIRGKECGAKKDNQRCLMRNVCVCMEQKGVENKLSNNLSKLNINKFSLFIQFLLLSYVGGSVGSVESG